MKVFAFNRLRLLVYKNKPIKNNTIEWDLAIQSTIYLSKEL
jgi:hypothetical protein